MNQIVIDMLGIPIFNDPVDKFLFEEIFDPILPGAGIPLPLPVRFGLLAAELQFEAGQVIAAGDIAGTDQYTGQRAAEERARSLGLNLMYQPGGMKV